MMAPYNDQMQDAIKVLNQIQCHPGRSRKMSSREKTQTWLRLLGVADEVQKKIYVHVAGTKGKGTTCYFLNDILVEYAKSRSPPLKTACLTSPHISHVTERIRIGSSPIRKDLFAKYTLELWDSMQRIHQEDPSTVIPSYPGFLTLLAFFIIVRENVDIAVLETGIGGENDSTNVIIRPSATGITSLGLDHVDVLGDNIQSIAWHKGGIFKPQAPAFTVEQTEPAMAVLRKRCAERGVQGQLTVVTESISRSLGIKVYPDMPYQWRNASLAICLAEAALKMEEPEFVMTKELAQTIENTHLPGRNEVIRRTNTWLLSVAHNELSIKEACVWFREFITQGHPTKVVLVFSQHAAHRDSNHLLKLLYQTIFEDGTVSPSIALFCTNFSGIDKERPDLMDLRQDKSRQLAASENHATVWKVLVGTGADTRTLDTVKDVVEYVECNYEGAAVIVAGGLYLAGAVRAIFEPLSGEVC